MTDSQIAFLNDSTGANLTLTDSQVAFLETATEVDLTTTEEDMTAAEEVVKLNETADFNMTAAEEVVKLNETADGNETASVEGEEPTVLAESDAYLDLSPSIRAFLGLEPIENEPTFQKGRVN